MGALGLTIGIIATILSLVLFGLPFGMALGLVAIIFSVIGKKIADFSNKTSGVATAGLVLGIVATCLSAITSVSCALVMGEEPYLNLVDSFIDKGHSFISNVLNHYGL